LVNIFTAQVSRARVGKIDSWYGARGVKVDEWLRLLQVVLEPLKDFIHAIVHITNLLILMHMLMTELVSETLCQVSSRSHWCKVNLV